MGRARQIANADEMGRILLDASAASTDEGEHLLLDASAAGTDVGFFVNVEDGTGTGDGGVSNFNALQGSLDLTSQVTGALGIANGGTALTEGFLNGLTFYETMRLTGAETAGDGAIISGTFESTDTGSFGKKLIGGSSGMSVSSGVFTFPATGIYLLQTYVRLYAAADASYHAHTIRTTNDNFSSNDIEAAQTFSSWGNRSGTAYEAMHCNYIFDCTDTSTHKFRMRYASTATVTVQGNTDANETYVTIIRLGDT